MSNLAGTELARKVAPATVNRMPIDKNTVLVIGDDIGVFLSIARSLGRAGLAVHVATCGEDYPGIHSAFVKKVHHLPPYLRAPDVWADELVSLVKDKGYGLVIPSSDSSLDLLATVADHIKPSLAAVPERMTLATLSNKAKTRDLARSLGVAVTEGQTFAGSGQAEEFLATGSFPVVIKPSEPYLTGGDNAKTSAKILHHRTEISEALELLGDREVVVEEFFAGEGVGVSVIAKGGHVLSAWQHRRMASAGDVGRSSQRRGEAVDPTMLCDVEKMVEATGFTGVAMFEFRQNPKRGDHVLLEVNPRFWGSLPLAVAGGADFPLFLWQILTGSERTQLNIPFNLSVSKTSLTADFDRISDEFDEGRSKLGALVELGGLLLHAIFAPARFDGWATDDPRPHWRELNEVLRRCFDTLRRRATSAKLS